MSRLSITSDIEDAIDKWEEIAKVNENYIVGDGWIEIQNSVTRASDARQHYTIFHARYQLKSDRVIQSLCSIKESEDFSEIQRFVTNLGGIRAELLELRENGLKAPEYAKPSLVNLTTKDISPTRKDLAQLEDRVSAISEIHFEETVSENGTKLIIFTVEYGKGTTGEKVALFPENYGYVGKVEKYFYDKSTGICIEKQEAYIKEGGQLTEYSKILTTINKHQELPKSIENELKLAQEELTFYTDLFTKP